MAIVVERNDKVFEIPEEGLYQAVVGDIVDLGNVDTMYGKKHKVRFVYFLNTNDSEGRRFRVFQQASVSLNEKSTMYKVVKRLLGNKEPDSPFDLETLIGRQCQLDIGHNENEGKTYANVVAVLSPTKGQHVEVPDDFAPTKSNGAAPKSAPKSSAAPRTATGVNVKPQTTAPASTDEDTINL